MHAASIHTSKDRRELPNMQHHARTMWTQHTSHTSTLLPTLHTSTLLPTLHTSTLSALDSVLYAHNGAEDTVSTSHSAQAGATI